MLTYSNVFSVSASSMGEIVHTIVVIEFPPNAGCSSLVNLHSVNLAGPPCDKLRITMPRCIRLKLILLPSSKEILSAVSGFSEPARSIRFRQLSRIGPSSFPHLSLEAADFMIWKNQTKIKSEDVYLIVHIYTRLYLQY